MAITPRREEVTTTVVKLWCKAPVEWVGLSQVWTNAKIELNEGRNLDRTPCDDEIWYEPGDEEIAVCFVKRTVK